ncbi:SusC/RagA family TonB-linked outer membrane protein [Niabella soli]|uniref:TonB-dependent receptor n=1 Tax=Niabella soli DSM 19437 TaxID=929713 RepID=W0EZP7_9BACT|nr:TonB-dependent receptor [Niabella soli]AHF16217.1 TonB-dependent receptor [Niabella soli DSM 19437]
MKKLILILLLGTVCHFGWAQELQIKGTVRDKDNNPLSGATVTVKGTNTATVTDQNGNFSVGATKGQTLEFSYSGMETTDVAIKNNEAITVLLQGSSKNQMEEVVVIGYGTIKKKDLTGAVAAVTGKDLQANLAKSVTGALQGRIAGVTISNGGGQPGAGMSINIRGLSSLGSNTPLYVIDGVFGDINLVDPNDIASIDVLKDASAAAIYGSRAASGVVIITTKGGRRNSPTVISLNAFTGVQSLPKRMDLMNGPQWKAFIKQQGTLPPQAEAMNNNTDWQGESFHSAPINKINLDISGGGEHSTYNVSAGYQDQQGILKTTGYKAFNVRAKNTFDFFNNHLRLGNTFIIKSGDRQYSDLTITDILRQNPLMAIYDSAKPSGYATYAPWMKNLANPVGWLNTRNQHQYQTDIMLNGYGEVDLFVKGLKYRLNVGISRGFGRGYQRMLPLADGTAVNPSYLGESAGFGNQWLVENTLHFDRVFGKHSFNVLAGYSAQENKDRAFNVSRDNLPAGTDAINAGALDNQKTGGSLQVASLESQFGRLVYSYDSRYLVTASLRRDGSSKFAEGHRYGVFPSFALGWNLSNERFFESLKSSINEFKIRASYGRLGNQDIANYSTQSSVTNGINYIQGNALWKGAINNVMWVSPVDLSWESTTTQNIGLDLAFLKNKLTVTADYYLRQTSGVLLYIQQAPSSGLKGQPYMNAGDIDNKGFEFLANYSDAVGQLHYNIGINASTVKNNVKAITVGGNKEFSGANPRGEGIINWARIGYPIGGFWLVKTDGLFQSDAEAQAYKDANGNVIQPKAKAGDIKYIDFNGDGKITDGDDAQYAGSPFPKLAYGIRGGLDYKGVDLAFFFDGMYGNKIYNYTRARMEQTNEFRNYSTALLNSWTTSNTNTTIPRYSLADDNENRKRTSDRWLENGSFFRLKTLEVGYTLPKLWLSKASLKKARVFVAADNLFTITKYTGYTPDLGRSNGDNGDDIGGVFGNGVDYGRAPLARSIVLGIQASF